MTRQTPPTPVTRKDVEAFLNSCVLVRSSFEHHKVLFDTSDRRGSLLEEVAPIFFGDLNALLRDSIYLGICRLTDPEETRGSDNLTVKFVVKNADFSASPEDLVEIQLLSDQIHVFREKIVPARNKRIGHIDRSAAVDGGILGAAPIEEWEQFWRDLAAFLAILHRRYVGGGPFDLNKIGLISDGDSLVQALRESRYFREVLADPTLTTKCADIAFKSKYHDV